MVYVQYRTKFALALVAASAIVSGRVDAAAVYYTYDPVGRVATALYDNGACIAYTYDAVGNQTSRVIQGYNTSGTAMWGSGTWGSFNWSSAIVPAIWGSSAYGCFRWAN